MTVTLSQPTNAGDLLVLGLTDLDNVTSIVDNAPGGSSVYVSANARATTSNGDVDQIWYAPNVKAGVTEITISWGSGSDGQVWAEEFFGLSTSAPLDQVAVLNNQSGCCDTAPTITTGFANELVFSVDDEDTAVVGIAPGNPFIGLPLLSGNAAAYFIAPAAGSAEGAIWDKNNNDGYCTSTASFAPAVASAGSPGLAFITQAQSVAATSCSGMVKIQAQNSLGVPQNASQATTIYLYGGGLSLYSDSQCSNPIQNTVLNPGQNSVSLYFQGVFSGSYLLEAEALGYTVPGQTETVF